MKDSLRLYSVKLVILIGNTSSLSKSMFQCKFLTPIQTHGFNVTLIDASYQYHHP